MDNYQSAKLQGVDEERVPSPFVVQNSFEVGHKRVNSYGGGPMIPKNKAHNASYTLNGTNSLNLTGAPAQMKRGSSKERKQRNSERPGSAS